MAHTETKNYSPVQGKIMDHVSANSWINIINWSMWFVGTCKDAEAAEAWCAENSESKIYYFKAFEAASFEAAAEAVELYVAQGSESTAEGDGPEAGPMVYVYKTFI